MSIDKSGFLSPDVANWIQKHRAENDWWFLFVEKLNSVGQSLLHGLNVKIEADGADSDLLAMLLFTRALSNFQGTVLMAERGMVVEARTLARSCLETTFCLVAMIQGKTEFADEFRRASLQSRRGRAQFILKEPDRLAFTDIESVDSLRKYAEQLEKHPEKLSGLKFEQIAEKIGLDDMYLFYRQLSADAAHPSIEALSRYVRDDGQMAWGPNCETTEISDTLNLASHFLICACAAVTENRKNDEAAKKLAQLFSEYKKMNGLTD